MNTNKFLLSGIAGGIACFIFGYVIFGLVLMNFMTSHAGPAKGVFREPDHLLFLYLIIGNLLYGFLLAYVFGKSSVATVSKGIVMGAIIGFLVSAATDSVNFATTWVYSRTGVLADVIGFTILSAIAGAVVAWIAGMGKKA